MQRDIKFRGWDERSKIMHNDLNFIRSGCNGDDWIVFVSDKNKLNSLPHPLDNPYFSQQIKIMQFTGLKDKSGVEIYEGDIVKTYNCKSHLEVIFRNACFCIKTASGGISDLYELAPVSMQAIEVIGNIYENPELLKSPD